MSGLPFWHQMSKSCLAFTGVPKQTSGPAAVPQVVLSRDDGQLGHCRRRLHVVELLVNNTGAVEFIHDEAPRLESPRRRDLIFSRPRGRIWSESRRCRMAPRLGGQIGRLGP